MGPADPTQQQQQQQQQHQQQQQDDEANIDDDRHSIGDGDAKRAPISRAAAADTTPSRMYAAWIGSDFDICCCGLSSERS
jgi:hypothetical protein